MKKTTILLYWLIVVLAILGLGACSSTQSLDKDNSGSVDIHSSKTSLNWAGVYSGTIPSASGSGINVLLTLNRDNTFSLSYSYIDKPENSFTNGGTFKWDKTGSIIILKVKKLPPYYMVGENKLTQLDMSGKIITGELAEDYVLKKLN